MIADKGKRFILFSKSMDSVMLPGEDLLRQKNRIKHIVE